MIKEGSSLLKALPVLLFHSAWLQLLLTITLNLDLMMILWFSPTSASIPSYVSPLVQLPVFPEAGDSFFFSPANSRWMPHNDFSHTFQQLHRIST